MRNYLMHSMGDDFGPFDFAYVESKVAQGDFSEAQRVTIMLDGAAARSTTLGELGEFKAAFNDARRTALFKSPGGSNT